MSFKLIILKKKVYAYRWLIGLCFHVSVFLSAYLITILKSEISYPDHFSKTASVKAFSCIVNEAPITKGKNIRFEAEINEVKVGESWKKVKGKCLIYIRRDSLVVFPVYGDKLLFTKSPQQVKPPMNPGSFNFESWLNNREIYHQVFLKHDELICVDKDKGNFVLEKAIAWREYLVNAFRRSGIKGREEAVLSALILGQDDEIDPELMQSYSTAGVLHILSVSGMHVGLIYGALCALIKFPGRKRNLKWLKAGILITCLWFYAMLTGLSPSVLRASMMISFVIVGVGLQRSGNPLNLLSASALSLFLIFSPNLIFSAGFQLSFLAVVGILFLYKPLQSIYTPTTWLGSQIWSILAVSIVAQMATFPLSVYYFHRFPNYFLLANLVVIPLGTFVIFGGIIVLFLSWWNAASLVVGSILSYLVRFLNYCVVELGTLPGASTDALFLSISSLLILYASIIFLALFLLRIKPVLLILALSSLLVFFGVQIAEKYHAMNQCFGIVYHSPKHCYIQFIQGKNVVSFVDSTLANDASQRTRISENYLLQHGINKETIFHIKHNELSYRKFANLHFRLPFIEFRNQKFYILSNDNAEKKPVSSSIDYLIITGNPKVDLEKWLDGLNCKKIISDVSNPSWKVKVWRTSCIKRGIEFVDIANSGAFLIE